MTGRHHGRTLTHEVPRAAPQIIIEELREACDRFDRERARQIAETLAKEIRAGAGAYPADLALAALKPLRRKRYFDVALDLADAVFESGQTDPLLRTFYAQALIDTGRLDAALPYVRSLIATTAAGTRVRFEAEGLLGRAYKQLSVNGEGNPALRAEYAKRAFDAYNGVFQAHPGESWHGINAVALHHREKTLPLAPDAAQRIFDDMRAQLARGDAGGFAYATAAEAALAMGDVAEARKWYEAYAAFPGNDAFEIASSLRQLVEVWRLRDDEPPGNEILPLLRGALLKREGGAVDVRSADVERQSESAQQAGLEKTFGPYGTETLKWYQTGLERCKAVCRIEQTDDTPVGTGFVVRGGDFHENLGDEVLVLTNHHVVNDDVQGALRAGDAQARFEALSLAATYTFAPKLVWSSRELDATLLRFEKKRPEVETPPIASECPARAKDQPPPLPRVFIIGHPRGGGLSFSLVNNELVAADPTRLHYLAPTEPGSSGSPVFNEKWSLVGLHHRGHDTIENLFGGAPYAANEAYWIGEIRARCRASEIAKAPRRKKSS